MELKNKKVLVRRPYKTVYDCGGRIVKVFSKDHLKSDVFNEALNHSRVEETGLSIPRVLEVSETPDGWAIAIEKVSGVTMEQLMKEHPRSLRKYMEQFVDIQLDIHSHQAPLLTQLKDKMMREINSLKELDATMRYELLTRLDSMKTHTKVCHGDFNPSNVIVSSDGSVSVIDWAHATQGNAAADAAMTFLLFALEDQKKADLYLDLFCKKSDTAKQYVQQWLSIVAAAQLTKGNAAEKEFLMRWIDVVDYQ